MIQDGLGVSILNSAVKIIIMKANFSSTGGNFLTGEILRKTGWLALVSVAALPLWATVDANALEVQYVNVNGKTLPFRSKESVNLGSFPENIVFGFGSGTNADKPPLRLRYTLDGYE